MNYAVYLKKVMTLLQQVEWHERRIADSATVRGFTVPDPGLIHVRPHISGDSSSFDGFRLMFTDILLFTAILTETNCYYEQYIRKPSKHMLLSVKYTVTCRPIPK